MFICSFFLVFHLYIYLFCFGFLKHFLANMIGLHTFYCNHSVAAKNTLLLPGSYHATGNKIVFQSVFAGLAFVLLGSFLHLYVTHRDLLMTIPGAGFLSQIVFEIIPTNERFVDMTCRSNMVPV